MLQKLKDKRIYKSNFFSLWKSENTHAEYASLNEAEESVMVLPLTKTKEIYFVNKYCPAMKSWEIILPGGKVKSGEKIKDTVKRELEEEIGFSPQKVKKLITVVILPRYIVGKTHFFIAEDLTEANITKKQGSEKIKPTKIKISDIRNKIKNGKIRDSRSISLLYCYLDSL